MPYGPPQIRNFLLSVFLITVVLIVDIFSLYFIRRFDVDVPGGRVYKESSFTEAGRIFTLNMVL